MFTMKKIFSLFLIFVLFNLCVTPAYAVSADSRRVIKASFVSDLDVNKSSNGQIVQFRTTEDYTDAAGKVIPQGTIFKGHIKSVKHGRWAYRRAKVRIVLTEMRFPDGTVYQISGNTKRKVLKGSAIGNIAKGIGTLPFVIVTGVGGTFVILLECVTIVGIIFIVPTGAVVSGLCGKFSNGINCKKNAGDVIKLEYSVK